MTQDKLASTCRLGSKPLGSGDVNHLRAPSSPCHCPKQPPPDFRSGWALSSVARLRTPHCQPPSTKAPGTQRSVPSAERKQGLLNPLANAGGFPLVPSSSYSAGSHSRASRPTSTSGSVGSALLLRLWATAITSTITSIITGPSKPIYVCQRLALRNWCHALIR